MNWYLKVLKNYTCFSGRAPRSEYWWFSMFNFLISIALSLIASLLGDEYVISGLYSLFIFLPGLAVTIRRIHDALRWGSAIWRESNMGNVRVQFINNKSELFNNGFFIFFGKL
jgi:uncharacterized membrane protein YhaH (DUF805 family)